MNMDVRRLQRPRPASGRGPRLRAPARRLRLDAGVSRAIRPELFLVAIAAVTMLLVEVWQSSRVTELCLSLEKSRTALQHVRARLEVARATLERQATRAELVPLASELGLAPADAKQVVQLPAEYLADADAPAEGKTPAALAWAERAASVLVPDATARVRDRTPANEH
jgi:hypothetical protein